MSMAQCCSQATQQGLILDAKVVEVINCVYQKSHNNYTTTPRPACILAICTVFSIKCTAPNTQQVQRRTTVNRLHARSAMYLSAQPSWWSRPVTHVQLAGHVSTTGISCRLIHVYWIQDIIARITSPATSVSTQLLKWQLERSSRIKRFFISSESVVELCRVPNLPKVSTCRVWCAPNDNYRLQTLTITG